MRQSNIPIISLFCGAGGLDLGFRRERFKVLVACDKSDTAINSYNLNTLSKVGRLADLATVTGGRILELINETAPGKAPAGIIGGPPCQGFSRGNVCADPRDPRNVLPFKYAEIVAELNKRNELRFFVFENVMGLITERHAPRFRRILSAFRKAGFHVFHHTLNARSFGVAQNRSRLFIVGLNATLFPDVEFEFPKGRETRRCVRDAIAGLPPPAYFVRGMTSKDVPHHPNHWTMMPKSEKFKTGATADGRSFRRLAWDKESPTVAYGNREIHVHPDGGRRLSVHEAMLLQGFPACYRLTGTLSAQVTQVSNAVPPPVAQALARAIRRVIMASD